MCFLFKGFFFYTQPAACQILKKTWKGKYLYPKDLSLTDIPAGNKTVKKMHLVINHWQILLKS